MSVKMEQTKMRTKTENGIYCSINIRLPSNEKRYYEHQLKEFTNRFNSKKVLSVQFGKQDIRGTESITIINKKHCVPAQEHFFNKWELLGFVVGFNQARGLKYSRFGQYLKKSGIQ